MRNPRRAIGPPTAVPSDLALEPPPTVTVMKGREACHRPCAWAGMAPSLTGRFIGVVSVFTGKFLDVVFVFTGRFLDVVSVFTGRFLDVVSVFTGSFLDVVAVFYNLAS